MKTKDKIVVIVGQTASGKSDLAVELALAFDGEVISADSRQVYKGLDIGTGKITKKEMRGIPHYLLDVVEVDKQFSVVDFKKEAEHVIQRILQKGRLPIVAGGTGFYIQSLVDNLVFPDVPPNSELQHTLEQKSTNELIEVLAKYDVNVPLHINNKNKRKIIRAIEIASSGNGITKLQKAPAQYDFLQIGIRVDKAMLRQKIEKRNTHMLDVGLTDEVQTLRNNGMTQAKIQELGFEYSYVLQYLEGKIQKDEMLYRMNTKTWQYAKRQETWFKRDTRIQWFDSTNNTAKKEIVDTIKRFVT